jgi:hypothetical protein
MPRPHPAVVVLAAATVTPPSQPSTPTPARLPGAWPWLPALLVVLTGLGALRAGLLLASGAGLQVDEAQYWYWSLDLHWGYYSKPPVIAALIAASTALFGQSVLGVKALSMLCWLVVALLVFFFTRDLMRDALRPPRGAAQAAAPAHAVDLPERTAFWAALLFTTTPVAGLLGMAVTTDAPLLLCWTLASWLLWRALRSGRVSAWLPLGLVLGVGLLSKYTLAAWLPSAVVLAWLARQNLHRSSRAAPQHVDAMAMASASTSASTSAGPGAATPDRPPATTAARRPRRLRCLPGLTLACGVALLVCLPHLAWNATWGWPTWRHTADITTAAQRSGGVSAWASLGEFIGGQMLLIGPVLAVWLLWLALGWLRALSALAGDQGWRALPALLVAQASGLLPDDHRRPVEGAAGDADEAPAGRDLAGALTSARRHLLWLALPLLGLGMAQAINARAQMNWTAPVVPLLCIWLALHLAAAEGDAARRRRRRRIAAWGMALSLGLTLFAAAAPTVASALEQPWPARLDLFIRMRGWPEAYAELKPQVQAHPGWRVLGVNRDVISHGAWLWRDLDIDWAAWRDLGPPRDHYQLTIPFDRATRSGAVRAPATRLNGALPGDRAQFGEPLLVLSDGQLPPQMMRRLNRVELLHKATVQTAPGRLLTLYLWSARLPDPLPEPRP